jgi:hypothetical protein
MMLRIQPDHSRRWRVCGCVLVVLGSWLVSPRADAQALTEGTGTSTRAAASAPAGVEPDAIRRSLDNLRFGLEPPDPAQQFNRITAAQPSPEAQGWYRGRRGRRGDRGVAGLVLGAIGGFVAGGAIGAAVGESSCHCDDPALHGFVIGAPIGAVVGAFLGYAIAR